MNEFLAADADADNYKMGMTAFNEIGRRYGGSKTDKVLLFKRGNCGTDGPFILDSEFKRRIRQRAYDKDLTRLANISTTGMQAPVKEELMSMLLCDYRYTNMEMVKKTENWENHSSWNERGFFPKYEVWGPAHALSRTLVRFSRHTKDADKVKDTRYKEHAGNGWYALDDLIGELYWNEVERGRPTPYMTAFSFVYMVLANKLSLIHI